jgi:hypothetical protein
MFVIHKISFEKEGLEEQERCKDGCRKLLSRMVDG